MEELETYLQKNRKSVLVFPPLPSRLRYLIHKTTEDLPELSTFSVGENWCRRVVVCRSELRAELEDDSDFEGNNCLYEDPPSSRVEMEHDIKTKPSRSRACRRPDKPLYMPRAARERLSLQNPQTPTSNTDFKSSPACSSSSNSHPETTEDTFSSTSVQESCLSVVDDILHTSADSSELCGQEQMQKQTLSLHEDEALVWEQTQSCFADMNLEDKSEEFAGLPHSAETEDTETDNFIEQIKAHLKEADSVSVEHVHNDYSAYENVSLNSDDFRHVIEIYDFPAMFKTDDLLDAFTDYSDGGMKIKWVDNTHALGVFSSEAAALHALCISHPLLKARALSEGSRKAQGKALRRAEFLQPVKERPKTDSAVARRMVTRALGIRGRGRAHRY